MSSLPIKPRKEKKSKKHKRKTLESHADREHGIVLDSDEDSHRKRAKVSPSSPVLKKRSEKANRHGKSKKRSSKKYVESDASDVGDDKDDSEEEAPTKAPHVVTDFLSDARWEELMSTIDLTDTKRQRDKREREANGETIVKRKPGRPRKHPLPTSPPKKTKPIEREPDSDASDLEPNLANIVPAFHKDLAKLSTKLQGGLASKQQAKKGAKTKSKENPSSKSSSRMQVDEFTDLDSSSSTSDEGSDADSVVGSYAASDAASDVASDSDLSDRGAPQMVRPKKKNEKAKPSKPQNPPNAAVKEDRWSSLLDGLPSVEELKAGKKDKVEASTNAKKGTKKKNAKTTPVVETSDPETVTEAPTETSSEPKKRPISLASDQSDLEEEILTLSPPSGNNKHKKKEKKTASKREKDSSKKHRKNVSSAEQDDAHVSTPKKDVVKLGGGFVVNQDSMSSLFNNLASSSKKKKKHKKKKKEAEGM
mmetsp:Transcript_21983/g.38941  ORF Transcript_21983/g.38941 Transcript_21983/m.38941 type:complete len:478 (+) Transcript_21983:95-1528(+)